MSKTIEEIINQKINKIKTENNVYSIGRVLQVQNYILEVSGLENACFYEKVLIGNKGEGYIDSIGRNSVKVALVKQNAPILVGDEVIGTGKEFCAMYSSNSIGHVVDMFGYDKLMNKRFDDALELLIEKKPIPIMDRSNVVRPLLTGISGIDLIYPIGKGQRQLIIGDKKTGKTQIALDTIVNQKDKRVICIYITIGKTKKEVKEVYSELLKRGAMEHTVILTAFQDECPPVIKNVPFAGLAIAEEYMKNGEDVLVVIDDLKRHADVCREISLLAGKVPGRDAYPPDIFYIHARMLERGCQHISGGSVTILPVIETKGGDITDYISTNIISITDGQIVLSTKNFEKGQKPAIHYGLSVSRLGGAVQMKEIKRIGAIVRRELLSYLETREIFELANMDEMGAELRNKMRMGKEILSRMNQYKFEPKTPEEMIQIFEEVVKAKK